VDHPKYLKEKKYLELNIIKNNKQQEILNSIYSFGDDESRIKHRNQAKFVMDKVQRTLEHIKARGYDDLTYRE